MVIHDTSYIDNMSHEELAANYRQLLEERNALLEKQEVREQMIEDQLEIINALSYGYLSSFLINWDTDKMRLFRLKNERIRYVADLILSYETFCDAAQNYAANAVHPEDREMFLRETAPQHIRNVLLQKHTHTVIFRRVIRGRMDYTRFTFTLVEHKSSQREIVMSIRDVNDLIKKEREQQVLLKNALDEAERANRSKTTFLSNMSHDIRTPMNAIVGFTALATTHINDPVRVKDYLSKIASSSNHLLGLINDVLDMSRIESGKFKSEEEENNLNCIIDEIRAIMQSQSSSKQLAFNVNCSINNPNVYCDKLRLNRVLLNILSNAVKFTYPGGSIDFTLTETGVNPDNSGTYEFRIKDTGIGMQPQFIEHIFEPFEREEAHTTSQIQGTGLGMAITKTLVDMMGGSITVNSEPDKGSEFIVTVKFTIVDAPSSLSDTNDSAPNSDNISGKRILLVEDNELNREIASEILKEAGFIIDSAENGKIAVDKLVEMGENYYCVILMDVQMPVMNGYEATRAIRSLDNPALSSVPIIAMTANAFIEDKQSAIKSGMNAHVAKPIDTEILLNTIQTLIGS